MYYANKLHYKWANRLDNGLGIALRKSLGRAQKANIVQFQVKKAPPHYKQVDRLVMNHAKHSGKALGNLKSWHCPIPSQKGTIFP